MGSDAVVARGRATVDGLTLFGQNLHGPSQFTPRLCRRPGRDFAPGELSDITNFDIPQVRRTQTVLGLQAHNSPGFRVGLNAAQVAVGCLPLEKRLRESPQGLTGPDLVRLVLERSRSAWQAVDVLVGLIDRYGQGGLTDEIGMAGCDHAFLIADPSEAIFIETAGKHWVAQEIGELRALVSVRTIRQDWDRISPSFPEYVIQEGAWPADGSKVDFVAALGDAPEQHPHALNRWGRTLVLLQEQNGHIDQGFFRRLLRDHGEDLEGPWLPGQNQVSTGVCRHAGMLTGVATQAGFLTCLTGILGAPPVAWVSFGPPCCSVFFPVPVNSALPDVLTGTGLDSLAGQMRMMQKMTLANSDGWPEIRDAFDRLQSEFDQCVEEFVHSGSQAAGDPCVMEREALALTEHCFTRLEATLALAFEQTAPAMVFAPGV